MYGIMWKKIMKIMKNHEIMKIMLLLTNYFELLHSAPPQTLAPAAFDPQGVPFSGPAVSHWMNSSRPGTERFTVLKGQIAIQSQVEINSKTIIHLPERRLSGNTYPNLILCCQMLQVRLSEKRLPKPQNKTCCWNHRRFPSIRTGHLREAFPFRRPWKFRASKR